MTDILNHVVASLDAPVEPVPFDDPVRKLVHVLAPRSRGGAKTLCGLTKDQAGQYGPLPIWEAAKPELRCEACAKGVAEIRSANEPAADAVAPAKIRIDAIDAKPARAKTATKPAKAPKAKPATKPAAKAKAAPTAPKAAPKAKPAAKTESVREAIWRLMSRQRGTTEREVCDELGWKKAGATISRAIKAAPFPVRKERGDDGRTRYFAA